MICDRCGEDTGVHIMSMFNTDEICMTCARAERLHPRYDEARQAEEEAARRGEANFAGVGLPDDLANGGHRLLRWERVDPARVVQPPRDRKMVGANGVYHIAGDEETLCGRECAGWARPFSYTDLGFVAVAGRTFCARCIEVYAAEPDGEEA